MIWLSTEGVCVAGNFPIRTLAADRPFELCLVLDTTGRSDAARHVATRLTWPAGARAHILAIVPQPLPLLGLSPRGQRTVDAALAGVWRARQSIANKISRHVAADLEARGVRTDIEVRQGHPSSIVLAWASANKPDLILIGARAFSLSKESNLSPTAYRVYSQAGCSVLLAREPERAQFNTALRIDHSPLPSEYGAQLACDRSPLLIPSGANRKTASGTTVFNPVAGGDHESMTRLSEGIPQAGMCMGASSKNALIPEKDAGTKRLAGASGIDLMAVAWRDVKSPARAAWLGPVPMIAKYASCSVLVVR